MPGPRNNLRQWLLIVAAIILGPGITLIAVGAPPPITAAIITVLVTMAGIFHRRLAGQETSE